MIWFKMIIMKLNELFVHEMPEKCLYILHLRRFGYESWTQQ